MMLLDTNVVSEMMREAPDQRVASWAARQPGNALTICAVTVYEIESGIRLLPKGRRRDSLQLRWDAMLRVFSSRILSFDVTAAHESGRLLASARAAGRTLAVADAQTAGCALGAGLSLVTRNVKDFDFVQGLRLVNPFEVGE